MIAFPLPFARHESSAAADPMTRCLTMSFRVAGVTPADSAERRG
jgi:hypothetical protein